MIHEQLTRDLKEAMINKDTAKSTLVRTLNAAIHNREIELRATGEEMTEAIMEDVLRKEAKKRKESAELFIQGGRQDLADQENSERVYIESLLPPALSDAELSTIVDSCIQSTGASSPADFGVVMKAVMEASGGRADGKVVSGLVKQRLS